MTDVRSIAQEIVGEADVATRLARWNFTVQHTLRPGIDLVGDVLYMTFPLSRTEPVTRGRGKNAVTTEESVMRTMAVTSTRDFFDFEPQPVMARGFTFPDTWIQLTDSRWDRHDIYAYLAGTSEPVDQNALYKKLHDTWWKHVQYQDDTYYDLLPLFVLATYVYPIFEHAPYLHFNGTAASGKSQSLRLLRALGFNARTSSNMSTSSIFRSTAGDPGLLCIDEAESFESERGQEIRQLLNSGYQKGMPAYRMEKDNETWVPRVYDIFSPKALASINPLDPVLGSRCLTVPMEPAQRSIIELRDQDEDWPVIRNQLYLWAMENASAIAHLAAQWRTDYRHRPETKGLVNRMWDVSAPFLVLADYIDPEDLLPRITTFFNTYFEKMRKTNEATDRILILLKALPEVFRTKYPILPDNWWTLKDIHEVAQSYIDADMAEFYKTKRVGRDLRVLGWTNSRTHKGGTIFQIAEDEVRSAMRKRLVEPSPEHLAWYHGQESFVRPPLQTGASQTGLNWQHEDQGGDDL